MPKSQATEAPSQSPTTLSGGEKGRHYPIFPQMEDWNTSLLNFLQKSEHAYRVSCACSLLWPLKHTHALRGEIKRQFKDVKWLLGFPSWSPKGSWAGAPATCTWELHWVVMERLQLWTVASVLTREPRVGPGEVGSSPPLTPAWQWTSVSTMGLWKNLPTEL